MMRVPISKQQDAKMCECERSGKNKQIEEFLLQKRDRENYNNYDKIKNG